MTSRIAAVTGILVMSLGWSAPALAGPVRMPHVSTSPAPTLYVNGTSGSDLTSGGAPNDCADETAPCATIQHAIDQAPSPARISVATGTYPEQLTIDAKTLTIFGQGKEDTVIEPATLTDTDPGLPGDFAVVFDDTTGGALKAVTVSEPASGPSSCDGAVGLDDAKALIYGVIAGQSAGCQNDVFLAQGSASTSDGFADDEVEAYFGTAIECVMVHCAIDRSSLFGGAYGIEFAQQSSGSVTNTHVSSSSTGVFLDGAGAVKIAANDLRNGVDVTGVNNTGPWKIVGNLIKGGAAGVWLDNVSGAEVAGNRVRGNQLQGIALTGVTDSWISDFMQHNGVGLELSDVLDDQNIPDAPADPGPDSGNTISYGRLYGNRDGGILAGGENSSGEPEQEGNTFLNNHFHAGHGVQAVDESTGSGTAGTANTWTGNNCHSSSPLGLCSGIPGSNQARILRPSRPYRRFTTATRRGSRGGSASTVTIGGSPARR